MNHLETPHRSQAAAEQVLITASCGETIREALAGAVMRRHEGIVYLFGTTNGTVTTASSSVAPDAVTTWGSFAVSAAAMARVVRAAAGAGLAVVGQIHTHPRLAFHSLGDFRGMRIRYPGYLSIVLPDYGRRYPDLDGAELLMCKAPFRFVRLNVASSLDLEAGRL